MRQVGQPGNAVARTLRFLRERDVSRIERAVCGFLDADDFVGARTIEALPPRAFHIAKATAVVSPMLAATYLRELVPPTSLDGLLAVVDRLLAEIPALWRQPRIYMAYVDVIRLEELLGRPLVPDDFAAATSIDTLTAHTRANVQRLAADHTIFASIYLRELIRPDLDGQFRIKHFVSELRHEAEQARAGQHDPVDN